jgi:membrane-associated phospholipid phosphatase
MDLGIQILDRIGAYVYCIVIKFYHNRRQVKIAKGITQLGILLLLYMPGAAQDTAAYRDTVAHRDFPRSKQLARSFILPAAAIAYGGASLSMQALKDFNLTVRRNLVASTTHPTHLDDYLQYAPGVASHVISLLGVRGKHPLFFDRLLIDAIAGGFQITSVFILKRTANEERPDHSDRYSFPSNHVAIAFASAELLRLEYKEVSPWYAIGGFAVAGLTAYLRLYNDQHWFGDVVAGAGIGVLSAKLANLLYPWVHKTFFYRHSARHRDQNQ